MSFQGWIRPKGEVDLNTILGDLETNPHGGAITTFTGIVRSLSDKSEKEVISMEVEAWEDRASLIMNEIAEEIGQKYKLLALRLVHLTGNLVIGDPIVYVIISSIHRKEAFAALEECITAYKNRSPVWKKEIYADGSGEWITTAKQ